MRLDLGRKHVFPGVVQTNLRQYILIWSSDKKIVLVGLTVPWEVRCQEAFEKKQAKYTAHRWRFIQKCAELVFFLYTSIN